jgi:hypothetical protein
MYVSSSLGHRYYLENLLFHVVVLLQKLYRGRAEPCFYMEGEKNSIRYAYDKPLSDIYPYTSILLPCGGNFAFITNISVMSRHRNGLLQN